MQQHADVAAVAGRLRERYPNRSIYNLLCDMEWNVPAGEARAVGGNAMLRIAALFDAGDYRDDLIAGGEPELCVRLRRAGWRVWRLADDMGWHDAAMTRFGQWWRRAVRNGHAFAEGSLLHGAPPERHYVPEARRALLWGLALPAVTLLLVLLDGDGWWLLLLAYPAQMLRLMQEPALLARVAADPALAAVAVEESLRHDAPVLGLFRTTTCPVERHGEVIPAGAKVMLHFGSANRDERAFADPDVFSLDRDPQELRGHLAFGHGIHVCLGAALSRLEGAIALRQVARRLPGLALAGTPERIDPFMLWGRSTLPARWDVPARPGPTGASPTT